MPRAASSVQMVVSERPDPADRAAVLAVLVAYNETQVPPSDGWPLAILLRDAGGATLGGLLGRSFYDWLFVELLAVPEALRRQGLGARLLRTAEQEAARRGCAGVWLDTFGFQARGFYERQGYTLFGTLEGHPRGSRRHFLQKRLD